MCMQYTQEEQYLLMEYFSRNRFDKTMSSSLTPDNFHIE